MTDSELILTIACIFLIFWCWRLHRSLVAHHKWINSLCVAIKQLQANANNQLKINAQNAEVRGILEDVNASLQKIVSDGK